MDFAHSIFSLLLYIKLRKGAEYVRVKEVSKHMNHRIEVCIKSKKKQVSVGFDSYRIHMICTTGNLRKKNLE